jgi:2-iminobutanoate/2-iminopropanoate deaminase
MDPTTGELVSEDVEAQAEQCLRNLQAVLEAAGSSFAQAVRCTVYLTDMGDFDRVNQVYARAFEGLTPPSRACVEVSALPKGALVEIDCLASLA